MPGDGHADGHTGGARGGWRGRRWTLRASLRARVADFRPSVALQSPLTPSRQMRTIAILPIKSLGAAKQRLSEHARQRVAPGARAGDVLRRAGFAFATCEASTRSWSSPPTTSPSRPRAANGVRLLHDADEAGQSAAAHDRYPPRGGDRASNGCCSCPATRRCSIPREVDAMLASHGPDHDRARPPRHRHQLPAARARRRRSSRASARAASIATSPPPATAGIVPVMEHAPSLMLDVDTPDDLAELSARLEECRGHAPLTRGTLRQLDRSGASAHPSRPSGLTLTATPLGGIPEVRPGDDLAALMQPTPATSARATCSWWRTRWCRRPRGGCARSPAWRPAPRRVRIAETRARTRACCRWCSTRACAWCASPTQVLICETRSRLRVRQRRRRPLEHGRRRRGRPAARGPRRLGAGAARGAPGQSGGGRGRLVRPPWRLGQTDVAIGAAGLMHARRLARAPPTPRAGRWRPRRSPWPTRRPPLPTWRGQRTRWSPWCSCAGWTGS